MPRASLVRAALEDAELRVAGLQTFRDYPSILEQGTAWYRSDRLITLNDSTVSAWGDLAGNGNTATQGTEANQLTYTQSAINGRPALQTDGNDGLIAPAMNYGTSAVTVMVVAHIVPDSSIQQTLLQQSSGNGTQYRIPSATNKVTFRVNSDAAHSQVLTEGDYVVLIRFDGSAAEAQRVRISVNGDSEVISTTDTAMGSSDGNLLLLRADANQPPSGTRLLEVFLVGDALSDAEFESIENYALARYGL